MRGTRVLQEAQANITPPQEIAIRKLVAEAVNKKAPIQSKLGILDEMEPGRLFNRRKMATATSPIPQMGRLIQNIHLQVTC